MEQSWAGVRRNDHQREVRGGGGRHFIKPKWVTITMSNAHNANLADSLFNIFIVKGGGL